MRLPFSRNEFLAVFAAYNEAQWPVALALWVASLVAVTVIVRHGRVSHRAITVLLAFHWAWSGLAYHAAYFTTINAAGWLFAAAFVAEATLLVWFGVIRRQIEYTFGNLLRHRVGAALLIYSLMYPIVSVVDTPADDLVSITSAGLAVAAPLFAVPCPTTLYTAGLLLMVRRPRASLAAVPVVWSFIAGSSALLLGIHADLVLFGAGVLLAYDVWARLRHQAEPISAPFPRPGERCGTGVARPEVREG